MKKIKLILNESLISNKDSDIIEDVAVQRQPDYQIIDITVIPDEYYYPTIQSILIDLDEANKLCESENEKLNINILSETVNQKTGYSNSLFEFESKNHTITLSLVLQETERRGIYKLEAYTTKGIKVFESNTYKPRQLVESYLKSLASEYLIDNPLKETEETLDKKNPKDREAFHKFAEKMKRLGFLDIKDMTALSDNGFVDKLSFDDLNMFNKLENISYQDIQDMVRKELNEAEESILNNNRKELGKVEEVAEEEPVEEFSTEDYMTGERLAREVEDLNIDYSEWNNMTPEERVELVRPEISRFIASHKNEFDKNPMIFDIMKYKLTDDNFHTEAKVCEEEYNIL